MWLVRSHTVNGAMPAPKRRPECQSWVRRAELFKELTQVTVTLDLLVRKTLREPYLAIFCEPLPKR